MRRFIPIIIFSLTLAFGCNSQTTITKPILTDRERYLCDSLKIDTTIVLGVRTQTDSSLTQFPMNLEMVLNKDIDADSNRKQFPGLIFNATNANADNIVVNLYKDFQKKGYTIFFLDRNFGINNKPDILGILKTTDKYQILRQVQTDGINWEIDNDSLLNLVKKFDKKYSLDLVGASGDWCEFIINKEPQNWLTLAKEAYKVCPDIVDQGSGTVEKLAAEMKQTKRLYFWWD
jgi:Domain of unknown function (DUF4253)